MKRPTGCNGFDIVIGNPPYKIIPKDDRLKQIYDNSYTVACGGKRNLYHLFFEQGILLLRKNGILSYISPDTYFSGNDTQSLRKYLVHNTDIKRIVHYTEKDKVFENVTQAVAVIVLQKQIHKKSFSIILSDREEIIEYKDLSNENKYIFKGTNPVIERMKLQETVFGDVCEGYQGEVNLTQKKDFISEIKTSNTLPLVRGNQISKYNYEKGSEYCSMNAISRNHTKIQRIVFQEVSNMGLEYRIKATILKDVICGHSTNYLFSKDINKIDNRYVLGVLNSKVINYYFKFLNQTNHVPIGEIKQIPFPVGSHEQQTNIINLVEKILTKKKSDPTTDTTKLESEIDLLVFNLYNLTSEEICIIEGK